MRLDRGGSGSIGRDDLIEPLRKLGMSELTIDLALAELGEGGITFDDFVELVQVANTRFSTGCASMPCMSASCPPPPPTPLLDKA